MASSTEGFPAGFKGRVGKVVVYQLMGKTVMRSLPANKPAPAQGAKKKNQNDFAHMMKIMQAIKPFIRLGFHDAAEGRTAFHTALSENIKLRQVSDQPENLQWLMVSKGERSGATGLDAQQKDDQVMVSWDVDAEANISSGNDMVMLLALNTTTLECSCNLDAGKRSMGQAFLPVPPALPGQKILLFITFRNITGTAKKSLRNVSSSQWVEMKI
jgi:hypothetical protein